MRNQILTSIAIVPLLFGCAQGAQDYSKENSSQSWAFSSDESGSSSYLGVDIADVTAERLSALKLKEEKGVEVNFVDPDSPAGKAGMKEHDVILSMNGASVESAAQLRRMIHETPPGRVITLGLSRDGMPVTVKVQLADKHKEFSLVIPKPDVHVQIPEIHIPDIDLPAMNMVVVTSSARSGLTVENITPQLGEFFGVKSGNGVLVRSVEKGSRAEKAGFHAGDVVVKVNGQAIHDTSDFSHAVRSRNGNSVNVGVVRDKKEQSLTLVLPERKEQSEWFEEESFDQSNPLAAAGANLELGQLRDEIASLQPQMELADLNKDLGKELEQAQKNFREEQKRFARDLVQQAERQRKNWQGEEEKLKKELERMQSELRSNWL